MELIQNLYVWLCWYFRPAIKWFLRQTTRLCELQRICYGEAPGAQRTMGVEMSLSQSRSQRIQEAMKAMYLEASHPEATVLITTADEDNKRTGQNLGGKIQNSGTGTTINVILHAKKIKRDLHIQFVHSLEVCLVQLVGYQRLMTEVETLRSTTYNSEDLIHEQKLLQLWSLLQPAIPLPTRKTKLWQNIGFQGTDPKTDFRGMGLLGLENLLYFAKEYNTAAKHILSHSHHPKHGYSFAIVGINLTHMALKLLQDGSAKSHMFNVCALSPMEEERIPILKHFHHFYSYLFVEFDKFWLAEKPRDVMEFTRIRDLFENQIRTMLADRNCHFRINITVENV